MRYKFFVFINNKTVLCVVSSFFIFKIFLTLHFLKTLSKRCRNESKKHVYYIDMDELPKKDFKKVAPSIRTFASDMADAVRGKQASVATIAHAEQKKNYRGDDIIRALDPHPHRKSLVVGIAIVVLLAGGIIYYAKSPATPSLKELAGVKPAPQTFFIPNTYKDIHIEGFIQEQIVGGIRDVLIDPTLPDGITNLQILEKGSVGDVGVGVGRLFILIDSHMPSQVSRNVGKDYMIGSYKTAGSSYPFILFRVSSYSNVFSGMYAWERDLVNDLSGLFNIDTRGVRADLPTKSFIDKTIKNHDARVLSDSAGAEILIYNFLLNNSYLLITTNDAPITELETRLAHIVPLSP